ncbi:uncharacterized protein LOC133309649 [Gastrolobium bilobum]|uniref:uncharacterized protein LOC133309649 n=1 Tax=Gastrolobium bilobum TaxID=150636 RepID=UPI002AAFB07A|nr:uncharacterized protein LOC133309649 [Gastrolobium bilobum]
MYRPFMSCDDPKGVVDCGAMRKYKTNSQKMKDKTKSRRTAESLETSLTNKPDKEEKVSKGSTERSFDQSSLQLVEVSRGAQRLNNMIDSWSKGVRYDGRSEDIAKDLLKGALDLQESLVMLHKVQEASQHMARSKRKQNEKAERGRIDAKVVDRTTHSDHFGEQCYPMGYQRPWPSADGSSSSCTEELKKVIKESLVRQNLLPGTITERLDSASVFPSTNSSQSSGAWNDMLSDSSFSPSTSRKERGPNLVAKLMGLEEVPSRSFPTVLQKQLESQKIMNQKRPIFEIDMPKVRKNGLVVEKVNPERHKTLREILETTHFNGLLKKSSVREPKLKVLHSNYHHYKQFGDLPPIVLMKPRYTPHHEFVETYDPVPPEELSLRNLKAKAVPSKKFKHREGSTTNMGKEMEEHVSKRLIKEERTKRLREVVELDAKEIKPIENEKAPRGKVKLCGHASHKSQVSETVVKKAKAKTSTISKKKPEKEISKPEGVTKSQDQGEISSTITKLRKPQSGSRIDKNEIPCKKSTASNSITISKPKNKKFNNSTEQRKNQTKKQRSVAEPEAAKPVDEQLGQEEEGKIINVSCKDDCTEIRIITTITDDLVTVHEVDASADRIRENCKQFQSSSGDDILMLKSEHEDDAIPTEEPDDSTKIRETDCKPDKDIAELKYLLLTSQSFVGHAEELLNLDVDCPIILPKYETNVIGNVRLLLDCANELTERKSLQESQVVHPLLVTCTGNSRLHISLGRLVQEVYNAIENLTSYSENSGKKLASDSIYAMMERDIKCNNGLINGIWNWGWKHGFSADEAEQVVNEVENLVLCGLIEEVIVNL